MVHGDSQSACDGPGERHRPRTGRTDDIAGGNRKIDSPVASVLADGTEWSHDARSVECSDSTETETRTNRTCEDSDSEGSNH